MGREKKLLFIYNADAGLFNGAIDSLHKIVSPDTYSCSLCLITHHTFGMRKEWREFINQSSFEARFLHKDEIVVDVDLPVILWDDGSGREFITSDELSRLQSLNGLMELIQKKISVESDSQKS